MHACMLYISKCCKHHGFLIENNEIVYYKARDQRARFSDKDEADFYFPISHWRYCFSKRTSKTLAWEKSSERHLKE